MKLVACCSLEIGGARLAEGDSFEATDYSGAKLIAQGAAKAAPKTKAKAKSKAKDSADD